MTTRMFIWLIGLPLGVLGIAALCGLGESSPHVFFLLLTAACGFIGTACPGIDAPRWRKGAIRFVIVALACWLSVLALGIEFNVIHGLWFLALLSGWYGMATLLAWCRLGPSARVMLLGALNILMCSTPFWSNGLVARGGDNGGLTAQWLVSGNPLLTASHAFFGDSPLLSPLMYMERLSSLTEYTRHLKYASATVTMAVNGIVFVLAAMCVVVREQWREKAARVTLPAEA